MGRLYIVGCEVDHAAMKGSAIGFAGLCLLAATAVDASWRQGVQAGIGHDSNPANASYNAEERPATHVNGTWHGEHARQLSERFLLAWRQALELEAWTRHEDLSQARIEGTLRLSFRPTQRFYAPLLSLWGGAAYAVAGSEIRSGAEYRLGLAVREALTTRVAARLSAQASMREARGRAFDTDAHSLALDLDWRPAHAWTLYVGYQRRDGDLVSTSRPLAWLASYASAVDDDDAFAPGEYAYRLDAETDILTLGINRAWSPSFALDLQAQSIDAVAGGGVRYERQRISLGALLRF
jgi:hypothetical protein